MHEILITHISFQTSNQHFPKFSHGSSKFHFEMGSQLGDRPKDAETLFFCGTSPPGLENLGLLTLALKKPRLQLRDMMCELLCTQG